MTGAGSEWNTSGALAVGHSGSGTLHVADGGLVSNEFGHIGVMFGSTGTATVTGANSQWTNSRDLHVGDGGNGTLNVEAGGLVSNIEGRIGYESGSSGTATVTGAGSEWDNSGSLYIGGKSSSSGGSGTLNLTDSGLTTVGGTTKLWDARTLHSSGDLASFACACRDSRPLAASQEKWGENTKLRRGFAG